MWWMLVFSLFVLFLMLYNIPEQRRRRREVKMVFDRHNILDCNLINVPCVTNEQCRDNCREGMLHRCNEWGFCQRTVQHHQQQEEELDDCDASRGLITILNAMGEIVKKMCVSLYRDVIDDNGNLLPYVCTPGNMLIDLEQRPFNVSDCICASGYTRFSYSPGAFSRSTPVCIPNVSAALFRRVYE
ncbi:per os infectivity factor 3 [Diatraea saccharalis granulovirus]|uniref:Per os infectivity factor 3 n=1 Tax=Diatraea saccharalis granulovirus TaxID=1675862 RepID=A0A0R7EYP7_9BBAC|nr:per os infectivity factor 3 [Diatraea saccharalis granulovirus]AKN80713.1 per os infectivity factor 3 [Diatraea saccharalis granulovirus]